MQRRPEVKGTRLLPVPRFPVRAIYANPGLASRHDMGLTWSVRHCRIGDPEPSIRFAFPSSCGKEPMQYNPANPLIVQGDRTILLEVDNPLHAEARDTIAPFAELEKSPEHIHTYRLTPLSLWNAAAAGMAADEMIRGLETYSKFPIPPNLPADLRDMVSRYGRVRLERVEGQLRLSAGPAASRRAGAAAPGLAIIWESG